MIRPTLSLLSIVLVPGLIAYQAPASDPLAEARAQLFAAHYQAAADSYARIADTGNPEAYYGLVRALLSLHRSAEAFAKADEAIRLAPQSAAAQTAAGIAMFRQGDLAAAEAHFRTALKLRPEDPAALFGMASIYRVVSKNKTALALTLKAYAQVPDDPEYALFRADSFKGAAHVAELQRLLTRMDPASESASTLRGHIAADQAAADRELRRLTSPYAAAQVPLTRIMDGVRRQIGVGLQVRFNQRQTLTLLLDTGASGISIAPKAALKADLQALGEDNSEAKGLGDQKPDPSFRYLASEVRIGNIVFADYPISVFRSAQNADIDGLVGADVFKQFIVGIDIPGLEMTLEPRPGSAQPPAEDQLADASDTLPPGFFRVFRFGDHLALPISVNGGPPVVFLMDTGSTANFISLAAAQKSGKIHFNDDVIVKGTQGKVNKVARANNVSLVFAGFQQNNPDLIAIDLEKMSDNFGVGFTGILGMPVLQQMKTTIDYREGRVRLEHKAAAQRP